MISRLPDDLLHSLRGLDACSAANAIEQCDIQLRNEGFTNTRILHCHYPELPPMLGYAITLRVRSANPPMEGGTYLNRMDWWNGLAETPGPHILVIEDVDREPGLGAFVGHVHSAILKAIGCVGAVTNGAVRELSLVQPLGFQLFSGTVSPSHAYVHVVERDGPVEIAGLRIQTGELLLGDRDGLVRIPSQVAERLPTIAARLRERDREVLKYCSSKDFSLDGLRQRAERSRNP